MQLTFKLIHDAPYYRHVWLYDRADFDGFASALHSADWDFCFDTDDVNVACDRWTELVLNTARAFIPNHCIQADEGLISNPRPKMAEAASGSEQNPATVESTEHRKL